MVRKIRGGGRYKGSTPMMVAKKVAEKICKNKIMFSIRETTKDSKKKTYHYTAIRNKDKLKVKANKSFVGGAYGNTRAREFYLKNNKGQYLTVINPNQSIENPTKQDYTIQWTDNPRTVWFIYENKDKENAKEYYVFMKDSVAWHNTYENEMKKGKISLAYIANKWILGDGNSSGQLVIEGPLVKHPFEKEQNLIMFDASNPEDIQLTRS